MYEPYVDACTSMNASIAAQLIQNNPRKPGVWAPEEYFLPVGYHALNLSILANAVNCG